LNPENPQSLYLLCIYISLNKNWPSSRSELLLQYFKNIYQIRKFPEAALANTFVIWSWVAFQITARSAGSLILREYMEQWLQQNGFLWEAINQALISAISCGFLITDDESGTISFAHHRYQEFFTAYYIKTYNQPINWPVAVDLPNWQEIILYLVGLGGGDLALTELNNTIDHLLQYVLPGEQQRPFPGPDNYFPEAMNPARLRGMSLKKRRDQVKAMAIVTNINLQTITMQAKLSAAVELSAIILKEIKVETPVTAGFREKVKNTIIRLAGWGNPATQVRMLWACQFIPDEFAANVLSMVVHSPVSWVRNQALALAGNDHYGRRAVTNINYNWEILQDLCNYEIYSRLPIYLKTLKKKVAIGFIWSLLVACVLMAASITGILAFSYWLYLVTMRVKMFPNMHLIFSYGYPAIIGLACLSVFLRSGRQQLALTMVVLSLVLPAVTVMIDRSLSGITLGGIFASCVILYPGIVALAYLVLLLLGALPIFAYLLLTGSIRFKRVPLQTFFSVINETTGIADFRAVLGNPLIPAAGLLIIGLLSTLAVELLNGRWLKPFIAFASGVHLDLLPVPLGGTILSILFTLAIPILLCFWGARWYRSRQPRKRPMFDLTEKYYRRNGKISVLSFWEVSFLFQVIVGYAMIWLAKGTSLLLHRFVAIDTTLSYVVIAIILILGSMIMLAALKGLFNKINFGRPSFENTAEWRDCVKKAAPRQQAKIIATTDPAALHLTLQGYYQLLTEVQLFIIEEPAVDTYWKKINELQQILKQENNTPAT
jgi:hypothetical protein